MLHPGLVCFHAVRESTSRCFLKDRHRHSVPFCGFRMIRFATRATVVAAEVRLLSGPYASSAASTEASDLIGGACAPPRVPLHRSAVRPSYLSSFIELAPAYG